MTVRRSAAAVGVLVPHEVGLQVLGHMPGLHVVSYDEADELPELAARVLVPPMISAAAAAPLIAQLPRLQLVQLLTAGADTWVGALPDGVGLSDCRGAHGGATAEWVLSALLAIYRNLPRFVTAQHQRHWDQHQTEELAGKRVLVVGAGDVGHETARRLISFDATTTLVARRRRPGVHGIDELPDLLPRHDTCVIAVPLTAATRGLVDAGFLATMPAGAVLVNAARGPVVDTTALIAALQSGRLRAALDVTDPEPLPTDHDLWQAPGLLLTPHVGGSVPGCLPRAYAVAAEQIAAFARGETPPNLVSAGY